MYGHYDAAPCAGAIINTNCHLEAGFDIVDGMCSARESCDIQVDLSVFVIDPCYRTNKYLDVEYTCVNGE